MFQNVETEEDRADDRSVEDLLSFINGGHGGIHECLPTVCFMLVQRFIFLISYFSSSKKYLEVCSLV